MRALAVLVLVSLATAGWALVAPWYRDNCYTDQQCVDQLGKNCTCLRAPWQSKNEQSRCYCSYDDGFFYGCYENFECQWLGKPGQNCYCANDVEHKKGFCKCGPPLLKSN
ncbi:hypothetical protein B5X24_HaOG213610 [Helicoverpa armigera]|uniref:EGF-like domain-containing protein n=1 Tax=Helicoverpa armigera TaxID=29058 RepID=A0A2W1B4X1_HELAM|nr:hypothetical protein B5X24_HaOG213610 [Helicoverpa armigera]